MSPIGTILEVANVSKFFGRFCAVREMSLSLQQGAVHALIGPNGAGKSTFLNLLAGALTPNSGDIRFRGRSIVGLPTHRIARSGIARSFQITSIFPGLSTFENVQIALLSRHDYCRNLIRPARGMLREEVYTLLDHVRMRDRMAVRAGELAAGDRKRLEFALALAGNPQLMLLDEPTAGMSVDERAVVIEVIREINTERGVTVLFTEHDIDMVFSIAGQVTVMHQGAKLAEGAPLTVQEDARVREVYLGEQAHADL